jgi:hypothetical protein
MIAPRRSRTKNQATAKIIFGKGCFLYVELLNTPHSHSGMLFIDFWKQKRS